MNGKRGCRIYLKISVMNSPGINIRCRLACVVKNIFSRQDHLRSPPMVVFAAIGRKRLRILGRVFLLSQIPVSSRHVCLNHCFRSLFQIYAIDFCFRTLLQISCYKSLLQISASAHCFSSLLQLTALSKFPELPVCDIDDNIHGTVNAKNTCVDHKIMSVA